MENEKKEGDKPFKKKLSYKEVRRAKTSIIRKNKKLRLAKKKKK